MREPRPFRPTDVLVRAGGGEPSILDDLPGERRFYVALGASLLVPFTMAILGLTVVLHIVTGQRPIQAPFVWVAVAWGVLVFTVDRLLLALKHKVVPRSDPGHRSAVVGWILLNVFRVLFALCVAFVISEPLIAAGFGKEAVARAQANQETKVTATKAGINADYNQRVKDAQTESATRRGEIAKEITRLQDLSNTRIVEAAHLRQVCNDELTTGRGPKAGLKCPAADAAERLATTTTDQNNQRVVKLQTELTDLGGKVDSVNTQRRDALVNAAKPGVALHDLGLWERISLVHKILSPWWIAALAGLLVLADSLPVLAKMIWGSRAHDAILAAHAEQLATTAVATSQHAIDRHAREQAHEIVRLQAAQESEWRQEQLRRAAEAEREAIEQERMTAEARIKAETELIVARFLAEQERANRTESELIDLDGDGEDGSADGGEGGAEDGQRPPPDPVGMVDHDGAEASPVAVLDPNEDGQHLVVRSRHFVLSDLLGQGGQGIVRLGRPIAPNSTDPAWVDNGLAIKRARKGGENALRREIKTYNRLRRDITAIPELLTSKVDGKPVLILELFPHRSLDRFMFLADRTQLIVRHDLPAWLVFSWMYNVADNLGQFWRQNQVNGDGKLANTLVCGGLDEPLFEFKYPYVANMPGTLKFCDLASSAQIGAPPPAESPAYAPPEYRATHEMSPLGDVYSSLGCTFWELLTGHIPSPTMTETLTPLRELNPAVPEPMSQLVTCCLDTDPAHRVPGSPATLNQLRGPLLRQIDAAYHRCSAEDLGTLVLTEGQRL